MSLDDFQARYTSEDNASFTEILDDENQKRRERFKWAWDAQRKAMEGKMVEDVKRERMLIDGSGESDQRGVSVRPGARGRITIEKPDVLLITQGESQAQEEPKDGDDENMDDGDEATNEEVASSSIPSEGRDVMAPLKDTRTPYVSTWKFKVNTRISRV
jgi:protein DGCR14